MRAVAKEMGKDVEFRNIAFDGLIPSLQSKEVDMSASGMTATKERAEKILFAAPFYETKLAVVTKADSDIHSVDDMNKGQEIAVQVGTTAAYYAQDKGMKTRNFDHSSDIIMELKAGGAVAGILDKPAADYFVATDGKGAFRVVDVPDSKVQYFAFGFNKDNKQLQQEVNKAIADLKQKGTLNELHENGSKPHCRKCRLQRKKRWVSDMKKSSRKGLFLVSWWTSELVNPGSPRGPLHLLHFYGLPVGKGPEVEVGHRFA